MLDILKNELNEIKNKPFYLVIQRLYLIVSFIMIFFFLFHHYKINMPINFDIIIDFCRQFAYFYKRTYFRIYIGVFVFLTILQVDFKRLHIRTFPLYLKENRNIINVGGLKGMIEDVLILMQLVFYILFSLYIFYLFLDNKDIGLWGQFIIILSFLHVCLFFLKKRFIFHARIYKSVIEDSNNLQKGVAETILKDDKGNHKTSEIIEKNK